MTILQIRAVLLTAELGSISAAAKELLVSQPNASNSIKLLEEEVGFPIFSRTSTGVVLTKKGELFLEHARQILAQNEKILSLRNADEIYRLRVGCLYYFPAVKTFLKLAEQHREDAEADFRYYSIPIDECINLLAKHELDIVLAAVMKHQVSGVVSECKRNHLTLTSVGAVPAVVTLRKDHPAVSDGRCKNLTQGSSALKDFPYITYRNSLEDASSTGYRDGEFAQCSYKMYVDDVDTKLRLTAVTNGFSLGIRTTNENMEQYGLVSFPVPDVNLELFVITRPADAGRRETEEYISLLQKELQSVVL